MTTSTEYSGRRSSSQGLQAGEAEKMVLDESTGRVMRDTDKELERVKRLLLGACRIISETSEAEQLMGPDLRSWWMEQPESRERKVRRILNEIPPTDVELLKQWLDDGGSLNL